jgi:hypothetical protein
MYIILFKPVSLKKNVKLNDIDLWLHSLYDPAGVGKVIMPMILYKHAIPNGIGNHLGKK